MTDQKLITQFLEAQAAELNAAQNTLLAYARDLDDARGFFTDRGADFLSFTRDEIETYLADLEVRGLSRATRARRLSALKQMCRFLFEEDLRKDDPCLKIKGPAREKSLPKTLSYGAVDRLLAQAELHGRSADDRLRNHCMMQILYATGMRVSELVTLPVASVRGDPKLILIKGKGGKERMLPLTQSARFALQSWLARRDALEEVAIRKGVGKPSRYLFPSRSKEGHMTRVRFYMLIKEIARDAGVPPLSVTPHRMRHAFATHLLAGGADLRSIQALLGHADIATTEIYTHILDERLKALVLEHHPLADQTSAPNEN
ncbi:tyrosine recombinase [Paracoccaceae bacterium]|nr:tyrosine recombinase [Paracoccaceae bacterium]